MLLIPGLAFTNAVKDIFIGDTISGVMRLIETILWAAALALGFALSGWLLGPWWGGAAAGIGSMLTDLLNGYAHYAPGTFVIKGCMAIAAALLAKAMGRKAGGYVVSGIVAEVIMVAGYFGYAALLLGKGIGAAASIPGNLVQAVMGLAIGLILFFLLKRSKALDKLGLQ